MSGTIADTSRALRSAGYLLFFLSGAAGLIFETLWVYQAGLALGNSHWAVTAVLSAFMTGLALGNLASVRWNWGPARSLRFYALLELAVLGWGVALVLLMPTLGRMIAPFLGDLLERPALLQSLRFAIAFLLLLLPTTAMGLTMPVLTQALAGDGGGFREVLGKLYGMNTFGAVLGILAAEFLLLPRIGVTGSALVAAGLNALTAAGAWMLARRMKSEPELAPSASDSTCQVGSFLAGWAAVALAGFVLLSLEVVWVRFLSLFMQNSSAVFAWMLAIVLIGIAGGGMVAAALGRRFPRSSEAGTPILFLAGAMVTVGYAVFHGLHRPPGPIFLMDFKAQIGASLLMEFFASFMSGAFFTIAAGEVRGRFRTSQTAVGLMVLVNTVGAAVGAVATGFLLIPHLGVERALFALAGLYGLAALLWWWSSRGVRVWSLGAAAVWVLALALFPWGQFHGMDLPWLANTWAGGPEHRIVAFREGLTETSLYLENQFAGERLNIRLLTNSLSMSGNKVASDRYMKQFAYLPLSLHPAPRKALLICFGVGSTAQALASDRALNRIDVVDISRDILEQSQVVFPPGTTNPLRDPRLNVVVEDGRFFLQSRQEHWDVITGEPPPPTMHGVASLYSREHFQLIREHLTEGGIASYWLPIHSLPEQASLAILRAWSDVFGTCFLWRGSDQDLILVGMREPFTPGGDAALERLWGIPAIRTELDALGLESPAQLGSGFIGDRAYIRTLCEGVAPADDDHPKRVLLGDRSRTQMYKAWFDPAGCLKRFLQSPSIAGLWPLNWKDRAAASFDLELVHTSIGRSAWVDRLPDFQLIHRLCTTSNLRTASLWALGSDRDFQRVVDQVPENRRGYPNVQFHLGARALVAHDYATAARHFLITASAPTCRRTDVAAYAYAACMAGKVAEASRFLAAAPAQEKIRSIPAAHWEWMNRQFGLSLPASAPRIAPRSE